MADTSTGKAKIKLKARKIRTNTQKRPKVAVKAEPPQIDYKMIGSRIRQARLHKGITQEYLSELIDVTPAFVGHIERGERSVSLKTILKLAMVLNVSTDFLFNMENTTEDNEITNALIQMINHRPIETKQAVLDIVSVALNHLA